MTVGSPCHLGAASSERTRLPGDGDARPVVAALLDLVDDRDGVVLGADLVTEQHVAAEPVSAGAGSRRDEGSRRDVHPVEQGAGVLEQRQSGRVGSGFGSGTLREAWRVEKTQAWRHLERPCTAHHDQPAGPDVLRERRDGLQEALVPATGPAWADRGHHDVVLGRHPGNVVSVAGVTATQPAPLGYLALAGPGDGGDRVVAGQRLCGDPRPDHAAAAVQRDLHARRLRGMRSIISPARHGAAIGELLTALTDERTLLTMVGTPNRNRLLERREATRQEILNAAWMVARQDGLAELTMRAVAARIGMRPPSLYSHFESKHAIYDAMFEQAWREYESLDELKAPLPQDPRAALKRIAATFVDFALADFARHQLMNVRTIPGFRPTPEAYEPAVRVLGRLRTFLAGLGIEGDELVDLFTALVGGLVEQQWANDAGGNRWRRLLDRAVDMYANEVGLPGPRGDSS